MSEREFGAQGGLYFLPISGWSLEPGSRRGWSKKKKAISFLSGLLKTEI